MSFNKTVEDLADDLVTISDNFVGSFEGAFESQDKLTDFLKSRERYWIGIGTGGRQAPAPRDYNVPDDLWKDNSAVSKDFDHRKGPLIRNASIKGGPGTGGGFQGFNMPSMPSMPDLSGIGSGLRRAFGAGYDHITTHKRGRGKRDQAELNRAQEFIRKNPNFGRGRSKKDQAELDRAQAYVKKQDAAAITKPTKALIGEKGPELVIPMKKIGEAINSIYKQGSKTMLEATAGFMNSLPSTPSKGKILGEINKLKTKFKLPTLKIKQSKFGIPNPMEWWNKGRNDRVKDENNAPWKELIEDDLKQRGQSDESFAAGKKPPLLGRPDQAFNPFRPADKGGPGSGPTPAVRQAFERPVKGIMNLAKSAGGAIGNAGKSLSAKVDSFKSGRPERKRSIPTPFDNGRDMLGQRIHLNPAAESGWKKVMSAAAADGVDLPSSVTSAFRDAEEQQQLIENEDDPNVITPAPQGMSPHQQGWAVDIDQGSKANEWMRIHGHKFGWHWEGPRDPVHFDFINNEPRDKYLQPDNTDWKPENDAPDNQEASSTSGKMVGAVGNLLKGAAGKLFGKKGDPADINETQTQQTNIEPPPPTPETETLNNAPVEQELKHNTAVFGLPVVIPGPTKIIPSPPTTLDPDVIRHQVVDQFGKGTRVEVLYV